ncbi:replication protein [Hahella aquimaris]|uniref:replication protein n=1 Tax=Hahella sp. HNIBRBA332 TaxID=3015983 RepID=UPI00273CE56E|nr:replication protein [Hahella sp. HNIBRBA332]WLQ15616.1 replication protein [Hahella sp. HNIBRBA332]
MTAQANVLAFPSAPKMEVVKADIDNGFFRLANELADSLCKVELSGRQYRVFMALIRKTYGYGKKYDWIVAEQLCQLMSYEGCPSHIRADIRELKARRMIVVDGRQMGPNPVISDWEMTKPSRPKTAHKRAETGPKMSRNQPVNEPKTACSYTTDSEQNRPKPARKTSRKRPTQKTIKTILQKTLLRKRVRNAPPKRRPILKSPTSCSAGHVTTGSPRTLSPKPTSFSITTGPRVRRSSAGSRLGVTGCATV